ncbi:MAG TPA: hypothetical protein ENJ28_05215 [Gammaproteobacteria bacterium]|nr:hypothetical protein [Gammaproteobacteria bacterium]
MRLNVLQFSYYSIDIFNILYDSFPVEIGIDFDGVIERYIKIKEDERIKKLKLSVDMADIINTVSVHSDDVEGLDDKQINKNKENIKKYKNLKLQKEKRIINKIKYLMEQFSF